MQLNAQKTSDNDSLVAAKTIISINQKARKAAILSLIVPGLGQLYNRDYWKIPVIYAVMGSCAYFALKNNQSYQTFRKAYLYRTDNDSLTIDSYTNISNETLLAQREFYRRNRDLIIVLGALGYALNSVEAYVARHLKGFSVSEDLALHIQPAIWVGLQNQGGAGISCSITFKPKP
ncbi:MAG: DUF5683 domain-containing protein [Bacteroidia bacterium]|nr:DUF5683 domain-containing protein [Bacteroidia bacterium]